MRSSPVPSVYSTIDHVSVNGAPSSGASTPTLARSYVYGSYIDEPLAMITGGNTYYYSTNNLYSVAALTDSGGSVVERYRYDPYGKVTILDGAGTSVRSASGYGNPWTYTGRRSDGETGLMYYRARMYDTGLGRFVQRDPVYEIANKRNVGSCSFMVNSRSAHHQYYGQHLGRYSDVRQQRAVARKIDFYRYTHSKPTYKRDPYGLLVTCDNYGGGFTFVIGGEAWFLDCWDECGNECWYISKSLRAGADLGGGYARSWYNGCLTEFDATTWSIDVTGAWGEGFGSVEVSNDPLEAGSGVTFGGATDFGVPLPLDIKVGLTVGYNEAERWGQGDFSHPCPCNCPEDDSSGSGGKKDSGDQRTWVQKEEDKLRKLGDDMDKEGESDEAIARAQFLQGQADAEQHNEDLHR